MINLLLIIVIIFYSSYYIYSNLYDYKINKLLLNRNIISIESRKYLLNKPLSEFYINSSHNSYLNSIQHFSIVQLNTIKNILKLGVRCIELDISHINNKPIIAHGTNKYITTTYLSLESILDTIIKYGFKTSDPLIIFCEIYNPENKELANNIKNIFINKFNNRISKLTVDSNNYIANQPIQYFLNKVILLGTIDNYKILSHIIYPSYNFINREHTDKRNIEFNNLDQLSKIYYKVGIGSSLSLNIDFYPLWKNNYKLIGMNYQMKDKLLYQYLKYFKNTSFIHKSELKLN